MVNIIKELIQIITFLSYRNNLFFISKYSISILLFINVSNDIKRYLNSNYRIPIDA